MENPTGKQVALIKKFGLDSVPPSTASCKRLIDFILNGNGTVGSTVGERAGIARDFWQRWCGVRVRHAEDGCEGAVITPYARSRKEVQERAFMLDGRRVLSPFCLQVKWDNGRVTVLSSPFVKVLDKENQNRKGE